MAKYFLVFIILFPYKCFSVNQFTRLVYDIIGNERNIIGKFEILIMEEKKINILSFNDYYFINEIVFEEKNPILLNFKMKIIVKDKNKELLYDAFIDEDGILIKKNKKLFRNEEIFEEIINEFGDNKIKEVLNMATCFPASIFDEHLFSGYNCNSYKFIETKIERDSSFNSLEIESGLNEVKYVSKGKEYSSNEKVKCKPILVRHIFEIKNCDKKTIGKYERIFISKDIIQIYNYLNYFLHIKISQKSELNGFQIILRIVNTEKNVEYAINYDFQNKIFTLKDNDNILRNCEIFGKIRDEFNDNAIENLLEILMSDLNSIFALNKKMDCYRTEKFFFSYITGENDCDLNEFEKKANVILDKNVQ